MRNTNKSTAATLAEVRLIALPILILRRNLWRPVRCASRCGGNGRQGHGHTRCLRAVCLRQGAAVCVRPISTTQTPTRSQCFLSRHAAHPTLPPRARSPLRLTWRLESADIPSEPGLFHCWRHYIRRHLECVLHSPPHVPDRLCLQEALDGLSRDEIAKCTAALPAPFAPPWSLWLVSARCACAGARLATQPGGWSAWPHI